MHLPRLSSKSTSLYSEEQQTKQQTLTLKQSPVYISLCNRVTMQVKKSSTEESITRQNVCFCQAVSWVVFYTLQGRVSQNLSFSFFQLDGVEGGVWRVFRSLTHLSPTPSGRSFTSLQFFSEREDAWNMKLWSNVRGFCATIWSSRMSSTAASNRRLEGKVAIVTASTDGWVTQYFFSSFQLQIELIKSIIESQAQKLCSHICKKRKLKSKEEFTH